MPKQSKCSSCYWREQCVYEGGCDDYTPIDEYDDAYTDKFIEREREGFREEWYKYIKESYDELFF